MIMGRRRKIMILRRRRRSKRRRKTDHKTFPECVHTVCETYVAPGIVREQIDII